MAASASTDKQPNLSHCRIRLTAHSRFSGVVATVAVSFVASVNQTQRVALDSRVVEVTGHEHQSQYADPALVAAYKVLAVQAIDSAIHLFLFLLSLALHVVAFLRFAVPHHLIKHCSNICISSHDASSRL